MKILRLLLFFFSLFLFLPYGSTAETKPLERPHWSMEVKGGLFYPDIDNWQKNYGRRNAPHYAATVAYKLFRQLEIGVEGGYIQDTGTGFAPIHNESAGEVTYELAPVSAFLLLRGVFREDQWIVPYIGGGWTRMFYREKIKDQPTVRGKADGYYGKVGLQFLLDPLDQAAANSFYLDFGVHHTYLFIEAQRSRILIDTAGATPVEINLGGTSFLAGLLFEF